MGQKCFKCHRRLTAEERLLNAIFGELEKPLCYDCNGLITQSQCQLCEKPTTLSLEGIPRCASHMEC